MKRKQLLSLVVVGTLLFGVTSATSDYIHEQNGTISICDPDSNGTKCITMQDKNLGASEAGTGASSYGKHYQWGNNHGFLPCLESNGCETFSGGETMTTNERVDTTNYGPQNYFDRAVFSKITSSPYDWSTTRNDNLRGGANDSQLNNRGYDETNNVAINVEDRQGPCEEGYHVPSIGEWNQVLKYWAEENGIDLYGEDEEGLLYNDDGDQNFMQFQEDFKMPFAGYRSFNAKVYVIGDLANLWSSSPYAGDERARYFALGPGEAGAYNLSRRAYAFSVRCFKNSYLSFPSSEGGEPQVIVNIAEFNGGQNTCTGSNYIFENIQADKVDNDYELTGVFECAFGNSQSKTVTLQLSGNLVADGDRVISGANVQMKNSEWTSSPVGLKFANTILNTYQALTATKTLFQKTGSMIGIASGVVSVQITVPAGTPDGTYNGTLVLTY